MKKYFMLTMIGILSFLGINTVSAATYTSANYYDNFETYVNDYIEYKDKIDIMIDYWQDNYSVNYPYYAIIGSHNGIDTSSNEPVFILYCGKSNVINYYDTNTFIFDSAAYNSSNDNKYYGVTYRTETDEYEYNNILTLPLFNNLSNLIVSNGLVYDKSESEYDEILIPAYTSATLEMFIPDIKLSNGDIFPTVASLYDGSYDSGLENYVTIDLNQYPYVILSLKDYTPRDTFASTMFVKGQLCPTTVYNYGLEEKKDYISGYQTQSCGYYYNDFTSFTSYIRSEDIDNHAVYYLTGYDSSKPNMVKVDTSIYDITYITSEEEDEPYVTIEGKNYPVLPYSSLTDTAALTEKNGISDTWTCAKYDTDCLLNSSGIGFSDLFTNPLEILKGLWYSITSIFTIISQFILLLPPVLQSFLYLAFMIAILLGIIKILL